jgi:hypothetical protein
MRILGLISAFVLCTAAPESVFAQQGRQFSLLMITDTTVVAGRLAGEPMENRWAVVETQTLNELGSSSNSRLRISSRSIASIDCSNKGYERIRRLFNLETDPDKPVRWAVAPSPAEYEKGFNPKEIRHTPVGEVVKREHAALVGRLNAEDAAKLPAPGTNWRAEEELAVDFACAIARNGMSEQAAAEMIENTLGLSDVKTLLCRLASPQHASGTDLELTVRFHDQASYVKVEDKWKRTRRVSTDQIFIKTGDQELTINRLTGSIRMRASDGFEMQGACDPVSSARKF